MTRNNFIDDLFNLAKACEYNLDKQLAKLYADLLEQFGWDKVYIVLRDFQMKAKKGRFPAIGDFTEKLNPQEDSKDEGQEISSRIIESVSRFGWYNSAPAKKHIGDIGWLVVKRFGGWAHLCQTMNNNNQGIIGSQLRELAASIVRRAQSGKELKPLTFAEIERKRVRGQGGLTRIGAKNEN